MMPFYGVTDPLTQWCTLSSTTMPAIMVHSYVDLQTVRCTRSSKAADTSDRVLSFVSTSSFTAVAYAIWHWLCPPFFTAGFPCGLLSTGHEPGSRMLLGPQDDINMR